MTNQRCQVCFHPSRNVRFKTPRLSICQWCINELRNSNQSTKQFLEELRILFQIRLRQPIDLEIEHLEKRRSPPPIFSNEKFQTSNGTLSLVRQSKGILKSIYRTLVDDTARQEQIRQLQNEQMERNVEIHEKLHRKHISEQNEIELRISQLKRKLEDTFLTAEREVQEYVEKSRLMSDATTSKEERQLKAEMLGILNPEKVQSVRPDDTAYEEIKRSIRKEDQYKCVCCGRVGESIELHVHHIIHLKNFGTNNRQNLATLCHSCHGKQHPGIKVTRNQPIRRTAKRKQFIAANIKTTGLSNEDSIIEFGAARFVNGHVTETFESLSYSKRQIPPLVTKMTGITSVEIQNAPTAKDAFEKFQRFIGDSQLVFHNNIFDMRFINKYAEYFNCPISNQIQDTLVIARKKLPHLENHKLATLIGHLQLNANGLHRAKSCSIATGLLYLQLCDIKTPKNYRQPQTIVKKDDQLKLKIRDSIQLKKFPNEIADETNGKNELKHVENNSCPQPNQISDSFSLKKEQDIFGVMTDLFDTAEQLENMATDSTYESLRIISLLEPSINFTSIDPFSEGFEFFMEKNTPCITTELKPLENSIKSSSFVMPNNASKADETSLEIKKNIWSLISSAKTRLATNNQMDVPLDWIVMNAPRAIEGNKTFRNGEFLSGKYYAAIDPNDTKATAYISSNIKNGAVVVLITSQEEQIEMALAANENCRAAYMKMRPDIRAIGVEVLVTNLECKQFNELHLMLKSARKQLRTHPYNRNNNET